MMLANALALGAVRRGGGGAPAAALRLEPSSADLFYIIVRSGSAGKVTRFQRNAGGSGANDLGGKWPEFRVTGFGVLAAFDDAVTSATWLADEIGAFDLVARNAAGLTFGSYHGLGAAGALNSETIKIDGAAVDHTAAQSGTAFEITNSTTATDGTDHLTRALSVAIADAKATITIDTISQSGMSLIYAGMPIATGNGFDEINVRSGVGWTSLDLGQLSDGATAYLDTIRAVRMRNPDNGQYVVASSDLPDRADFVRCRSEKQPSLTRVKTYLGQFSDVAGLVGAEIEFDWGIGPTGATASPANAITDPNWVTDWITHAATGGTIDKSAGDLTMTWGSGTTNLRISAPIVGCAIGDRYLASIDVVSETAPGTKQFYIGSNVNGSNSSPAPAFSAANTTADFVPGRNIYLFTATQDDPSQRFAIRDALTGAGSCVYRNPAAYPLTA